MILEFPLLEAIEEAPPTAHQIRTILEYLPRVSDVDDPYGVAVLIFPHTSASSLSNRPHFLEDQYVSLKRVRSH